MKINHKELSPQALEGLLQAFVQREGTDYGGQWTQEQKTLQVKRQLDEQLAVLVFDPELESFDIILTQEYEAREC